MHTVLKAAGWALAIGGCFGGALQILEHMNPLPYGMPVMIAYVVFWWHIFYAATNR